MNRIYIIGELRARKVKIGRAFNLESRLLSLQIGHPEPLVVHYSFEVGGKEEAVIIEAACHKRLKKHHYRGEWFKLTPEKAEREIAAVIEAHCTQTLTMKCDKKRFLAELRKPHWSDN